LEECHIFPAQAAHDLGFLIALEQFMFAQATVEHDQQIILYGLSPPTFLGANAIRLDPASHEVPQRHIFMPFKMRIGPLTGFPLGQLDVGYLGD
jgi:hypothetical protein